MNPTRLLRLLLVITLTGLVAAAFLSGNGTTTLPEDVVKNAKPPPDTNVAGEVQPDTGRLTDEVTVLPARRTGEGPKAPFAPAPVDEVIATIRDNELKTMPAVRNFLEAEGVVLVKGRIDLKRYGYQGALDKLFWADPG